MWFSKGKERKYRGSGMPHYGVKVLFGKSLRNIQVQEVIDFRSRDGGQMAGNP